MANKLTELVQQSKEARTKALLRLRPLVGVVTVVRQLDNKGAYEKMLTANTVEPIWPAGAKYAMPGVRTYISCTFGRETVTLDEVITAVRSGYGKDCLAVECRGDRAFYDAESLNGQNVFAHLTKHPRSMLWILYGLETEKRDFVGAVGLMPKDRKALTVLTPVAGYSDKLFSESVFGEKSPQMGINHRLYWAK